MHVPVRLVVKRRAGLEDWPVHLWLQQDVSGFYVMSMKPAGKQMNVWRPQEVMTLEYLQRWGIETSADSVMVIYPQHFIQPV